MNIKAIKKSHAVIVLDGWGLAPVWGGNAIAMARTPNYTEMMRKYPNTSLFAADGAVGLPLGAPGNSEAGHLNIGAGRKVLQDQTQIDRYIENGSFFKNNTLIETIDHCKKNKSNLHLMGLLSKGGSHSYLGHLFALLKLAKEQKFERVYIHLFSDGRDSEVMAGIELINELENEIKRLKVGRVASVIGRYYAMDRDNNWGRIKLAYDMLVLGKGKVFENPREVFTSSYTDFITDEFIKPSLVTGPFNEKFTIKDNDGVVFFNFRADRAREMISAFKDKKLTSIPHRKLLQNLFFCNFVMFNEDHLAKKAFEPEIVNSTLADLWCRRGFSQFHIAETEKYAHVTYFINGGYNKTHPGETWKLIPSPKVKTYDEKPEMSAEAVTETIVKTINKNIFDSFVINFANPDMVGHTGDLKATIKAVEFVDYCLGRVLTKVIEVGGTAFVLADHGNAEQMVNPKTGEPDTGHTSNPVPFAIVSNDPAYQKIRLRSGAALSSVMPTVLETISVKCEAKDKENSLIIS
ncbi:MAG: 2,3-bisphosphoglycerate-independent phosphoglycerate mutase [Candidatus Berkelbacteria bacterium]|nr:2,3-bisphosphoglycerate-independent phosphoglycerate mutase [Candidatus Berkelbacteria bacterium]